MSFAAIVLAAGHARRFGGDKLVRDFKGAPLVVHAIRAACAAPVTRVVVVKRSGAELDRICRAASAHDARAQCVDIESDALSDSLRAGLDVVQEAAGVFVFLGDMPLIPCEIGAQLAASLGDRFAAAPVYESKRGHPVLLSRRAADLARHLAGDQGAGKLLTDHAANVAQVHAAHEGVILDIDTIDDLERLARR